MKYKKSLKQTIKESSKNPSDQEIILFRTSILPDSLLIKTLNEMEWKIFKEKAKN